MIIKISIPAIFFIFLLIMSIGCSSSAVIPGEQGGSHMAKEGIPDWTNAVPLRVSGRVWECSDGKLCLISRPVSGARVSYFLYGEKRDDLEKEYGRYSTVSGRILPDNKSPLRKFLLVEKIESTNDYPPAGYFR